MQTGLPSRKRKAFSTGGLWDEPLLASGLFSPRRNPISLGRDRASFFSPQAGRDISAPPVSSARFSIGDVVRHRMFGLRGVVFDIDPVFANSEEWYQSTPEDIRPPRDQPFYRLLAENDENSYVAYVSQQNLQSDAEAGPVDHPSLDEMFEGFRNGRYRL